MFKTNVLGSLRTARAFIGLLRPTHGRLIYFGACNPGDGLVAFTASRVAVEGCVDALRSELQTYGINVIALDSHGVPAESLFKAPIPFSNLSLLWFVFSTRWRHFKSIFRFNWRNWCAHTIFGRGVDAQCSGSDWECTLGSATGTALPFGSAELKVSRDQNDMPQLVSWNQAVAIASAHDSSLTKLTRGSKHFHRKKKNKYSFDTNVHIIIIIIITANFFIIIIIRIGDKMNLNRIYRKHVDLREMRGPNHFTSASNLVNTLRPNTNEKHFILDPHQSNHKHLTIIHYVTNERCKDIDCSPRTHLRIGIAVSPTHIPLRQSDFDYIDVVSSPLRLASDVPNRRRIQLV